MDTSHIVWRRARDLSQRDLQECADLFSGHYGRWSISAIGKRAGQPVTLRANALFDYLKAPDSWAALIYVEHKLVGYAFSLRLLIPEKGRVTWVTQFVVHSDYRRRGLGTRLLRAIWSQSDQYGWGLVTASPFAVRALEKATLRACDPQRIQSAWRQLHDAAREYLEYVGQAPNAIGPTSTAVDTNFPLDHGDSVAALSQLADNGYTWRLGTLGDTAEWAAFTFGDQCYSKDAISLVQGWIEDCDYTVKDAYNGMSLDDSHKWAKQTSHEVDVFLAEAKPRVEERILDVGCGLGRHALDLASRGYVVVGVDFVPRLIDAASQKALAEGVAGCVSFVLADARASIFLGQFGHAICLYDVIGSFYSDDENRRLVENVFLHLEPGGTFVTSVMNGDLTAAKAIHVANSSTVASEILALKPTNIMQKTGNVFDPHHYVWQSDAGVAYRKEQFEGEAIAPCELIVRDRRYTADDIAALCRDVGFEVLACRFVRSGQWGCASDPLDEKAKEILLVCRKPLRE